MKTECIIHAYNIATLLNLYSTRDAKSTLTCIHYLQMISKWAYNSSSSCYQCRRWVSIQPISAKDTHKPSFPSQNPYFLLMLVQGVSFTLFFNFLIFLQVEQCCAGISASNVMAIVSSRKILLVFWIFFRNACFKSHFCTWTLKQ